MAKAKFYADSAYSLDPLLSTSRPPHARICMGASPAIRLGLGS